METRIRNLVDRVPLWRGRDVKVSRLSGGLTNENFRVDVDRDSFVLRVCSSGTDPLGIRRDHEYACSRIAAELGIGAEVVHFDPDAGILVVRFIDARPVTAEEARQPETLRRIVETIERYHNGPAFPGRFSAFETVRTYHRLATERDVSFPETLPLVFERMRAIEQATVQGQTVVPCHNDLLIANFLDDGNTMWLIDWEYAAMGDRFFDLANFAVNQELDHEGMEFLLSEYFGRSTPRDLARLQLMRLASDLREAFWGFLQMGIATLDFDYAGYAAQHLGRFLAASSSDEFESWLKQMSDT